MNNKLISFAAAAATLFAFAACNKDANQIDVVTPGTGTYAKVSISMGTPGTRAEDGNYDKGDEEEGLVNSIMLVVYDAKGDVVGYGSTEDIDKNDRTDGNVSDTHKERVIELTMVGDKGDAASVVAYVNVANEILPLNQAKEETTDEIGMRGGFVMTNSAIGTNVKDDWQVATDIVDGSLYSSPDAAKAGSATTIIHVERLAAKVTVNNKTGNLEENLMATGISIHGYKNEDAYTLVFDAENAVWAPTGTAPKMYKLKNQWGSDESLTWANNADNATRNFWARGFYYDTDYAYFTKSPDTQKPVLNYVSSNELRRTDDTKGIKMNVSDYTTEHTYGTKVVTDGNYNALGAATSAIVLGQYTVKGKDAEKLFKSEDGYDFYLLLDKVGGTENYTIFNEAQLKEYLVEHNNQIKVYVKNESGEPYDEIDINEYFKVEWNKTTKKYELVLIDSNNASKLFKDQDGNEAFDAAKDFTGTNARHYNLGYAYFFAPIEHLGGKGEVGQYGVVRNHSYQLNVTSINSLGAPLDDDHFGTDPNDPDPDPDDPGEEPIVPDPDETALIQAELRVLSWHTINQDVKL